MSKVWKATYVASRSEKKVAERLQKRDVNVYLPLRKTLKQWSDRKKMVTEPLLPGYLFVNIENNEKVRLHILETPGVAMFVRDLGKDAIIPEHEIDTLKTIERLGYELQVHQGTLPVGATVKINQGVFKGQQAQILEKTKDGNVYVFLLEGIKQCIKVKIPPGIVELVSI